jgi:hypothetical protein
VWRASPWRALRCCVFETLAKEEVELDKLQEHAQP